MRVLVVDCNLRYMNPMRALLPFYISSSSEEVTFFGPGYCSSQDIDRGLVNFVEREGPFDIEVRTVQSLPSSIIDSISSNFVDSKLSFYKRSFAYTFKSHDLETFWRDKGLDRSFASKRVVLLHQYDFQAMTENFRDYVLTGFDLIVGLSREFWESHDYKALNLSNEYKHTNCWSEVLESSDEKTLGLPNFVAPHEFDFNHHSNRRYEWSVVGTTYKNRGLVKELFSENSISYTAGRSWRYMSLQLKERFKLNPFNSRRNLDVLNQEFQYSLVNPKYGYTCGSDLKMPIRKFFEIPAAGCTLVASPCSGFQNLGFIDSVNSIVCEPQDILDVAKELKHNPAKGQAIAKAGQRLVLEKHSVLKRSEQLWAAIRLVHRGKYKGAVWSNGDILFHD